jgi:hypothetical protein
MPDDLLLDEPSISVRVEPLLLRRAEAARVLTVSPRMLDDLVDAGLISKVRIGGVVAFDIEDLRAFVRQAKRDPAEIQRSIEKLRAQRKSRRDAAAKSSPSKALP